MRVEVSQIQDVIIDGLHGELPPDQIAEKIHELFYHNKSIVALPSESRERLLTQHCNSLQKKLDRSEALVKDLEDDVHKLYDQRAKLKEELSLKTGEEVGKGFVRINQLTECNRQLDHFRKKVVRLKAQNNFFNYMQKFFTDNPNMKEAFQTFLHRNGIKVNLTGIHSYFDRVEGKIREGEPV